MTESAKHWLIVLVLICVAACSRSIYVSDGLTDGDTFYLPSSIGGGSDPVKQSWVTYSLGRSTCKLQIGGENPARNSSFDCEFTGRKLLLKSWRQKLDQTPELTDLYLDTLAHVASSGFLPEYVWHYFHRRHWQEPNGLRLRSFRHWKKKHLQHHKVRTRLIGSWGFAAP